MILLLSVLFILLALSIGSFLFRKLSLLFESVWEEVGFSFALGFGLLGHIILLMGLSGALHIGIVSGVFIVLAVLLVKEFKFWVLTAKNGVVHFFYSYKEDRGLFLLCLFMIAVFVLAFLQALLPVIAHDALCYHINIPKRFVQEHVIQHLPYLVNSLFPFLIQMHYSLALLWKMAELAQVFHLMTAIATFGGVVALAKKFTSLKTAIIAGLVFVLTPGIFNQMTIPYNDVALTLFTLFSLFAFIKAYENEFDIRWVVFAGVFSGFALGIKYLAVLHMVILGLLVIYCLLTKRLRFSKAFQIILIYGLVALFVSFIWYLRAYLYEGNPVYPFFPSIFGGTGHEYDLAKVGVGKGFLDFILVPWRFTMSPQIFGGTWAQLGCVFLCFLPFVLINKVKDSRYALLVLFSISFFIFWFFVVQNLRFLFPLIPVLSILVALSAKRLMPLLLCLLLVNSAFAVYHGKDGYAYLLGKESKAEYLTRVERSYPFSQWVNQNLNSDDKILTSAEVRMFYFDNELIREDELRRRTGYDKTAKNDLEVLQLLKSLELTYLFVLKEDSLSRGNRGLFDIRSLANHKEFKNQFLSLVHEQEKKPYYQLFKINYPENLNNE